MLRIVCTLLVVGLVVAQQEFEEYREVNRPARRRFYQGNRFNDEPQAAAPGAPQPAEPEKKPQKPIAIIKQINENKGDGTYVFSYETENGINVEEQGRLDPGGENNEGIQRVKGFFSFVAPDTGKKYSITYTADENGFQAQGDHIPTPPPIPAEILKALKDNEAEEAAAAAAAAAENNAPPPKFFYRN